jgi:hypothetical protein
MSFKAKYNGLRDAWFVFDSCLAGMMVVETWVMNLILVSGGIPNTADPGVGKAGLLRLVRLVRLVRVARLARIFRSMPEVLIFIKAIKASLRACVCVCLLLFTETYVFGIVLRQLTDGSFVGDNHFSSVAQAMYTLWVDGTVLDSPHNISLMLWKESPILPCIFWLFVFFSAILMLNMLVGVLCEVVSAVASAEKEAMSTESVKGKLQRMFQECDLDQSGDGKISRRELTDCLLRDANAYQVMEAVGVDVFNLVDNMDFIFHDSDDEEGMEKEFSFEEFVSLVLDHRGSNSVTIRDVVALKKYIKQVTSNLKEDVRRHTSYAMTMSSPLQPSFPSGTRFGRPEGGSDEEATLDGAGGSESGGPVVADLEAGPPLTTSSLRQELERLLQPSLVPDLSKVYSDKQEEIYAELRELSAQVRRDLAFLQPLPPEDFDLLNPGAVIHTPLGDNTSKTGQTEDNSLAAKGSRSPQPGQIRSAGRTKAKDDLDTS